MNIKKVDDKPMVIHTKEKPQLKIKGAPETKIKAFLTQVGDSLEVQLRSFVYRFPPLTELKFDPECTGKRFSHRESWCWEDDDNAAGRKIAAATRNGQIELVDCGCGRSFCLIVCGGARGGVWDMADVGIAPYGNGLDFLDWMKDFLDGKVI